MLQCSFFALSVHIKLFVVFLHCLSICKLFVVVFFALSGARS